MLWFNVPGSSHHIVIYYYFLAKLSDGLCTSFSSWVSMLVSYFGLRNALFYTTQHMGNFIFMVLYLKANLQVSRDDCLGPCPLSNLLWLRLACSESFSEWVRKKRGLFGGLHTTENWQLNLHHEIVSLCIGVTHLKSTFHISVGYPTPRENHLRL